ncbi:LRR receptor-like serine/threonine-protein kinase EFR [Camellia lanceoleosa]|uniref:LRR receptor-like serine/threonine-protein kinase EFR n=1 Tax=Camellia lanceoleosa TaxID=1840588 RepID=A0ACC0HJY3_9ERIC|nr:LRR receptor-like serine/threonine-protein kinase EFR [Camellia lanceoleosa]
MSTTFHRRFIITCDCHLQSLNTPSPFPTFSCIQCLFIAKHQADMGFPFPLMLQFVISLVFIASKSLFLAVDSSTLSIDTDKEALISFKSLIESPNPLSTWDQALSPCNWTRVTCNKLGQRVVGLDLASLGLKGSITPHIGNLSFLRSLQLQNNQLTGTFPDQLGNLFRLTVLNASFNTIQGPIPPTISRCIELRTLNLMQNEVSGRIPEEISHLTKLKILNLAGNNLSGPIPPSIANISSLTNLNLGTNTLSGAIPGDLSRLRNLKFLDLAINNLTGTVPPSIYNMSSLVYLALAANDLWGNLPSDVGVTLPNLLGFNFCINKFTGTIPGTADQSSISSTRGVKGSVGYIPPEYGLGEKPSTAGDVYSYGITLLELFTGKIPTDEIFTGGLSLKEWVKMAFPASIEQVLDQDLLPNKGSLCHEGKSLSPEAQHDCLIELLSVGLSCTVDSPNGRISMSDALCKLKSSRDTLLKFDLLLRKSELIGSSKKHTTNKM